MPLFARPTAEPTVRQPLFQRWRRVLSRPRAWPLVRAVAISVGLAGLFVLIWQWHGKTETQGVTARAAETGPAQLPAGTPPAANRPETVFNWTDDRGVARRAAVPNDEYLAYVKAARTALERDRDIAATLAKQGLAGDIAPVFDAMQTRVSRYADWAFDWWTSWILLGRAFGWTWDSLRQGHVLTMPDRVQAQLTEAIQQRFRDLALRPDITDPQLADMVARSWAAAGGVLARDCADAQQALADFVKRSARRTERREPPLGWLPDPGWDPDTATFQPVCTAPPLRLLSQAEVQAASAVANASGPVEDVILRLARPFATKLISFIVLPGIIAAVIGGFVLPLFGLLPNIISGVITGVLTGAFGAMVIGFAASASVDLALNRTDEALNRPQFEASARKAIIAVQAEFETRVADAEQRAIDEAVRTRLAALSGQMPKR